MYWRVERWSLLAPPKKNLVGEGETGRAIGKYRRKCNGRRCCLGAEFIQFLAAQLFLTKTNWRIGWIGPGWFGEKDEFILFFKIVLMQNTWRVPQTSAKTFAFSSVRSSHTCRGWGRESGAGRWPTVKKSF